MEEHKNNLEDLLDDLEPQGAMFDMGQIYQSLYGGRASCSQGCCHSIASRWFVGASSSVKSAGVDPEKKHDGDDFKKLEGAEEKQDGDDTKKLEGAVKSAGVDPEKKQDGDEEKQDGDDAKKLHGAVKSACVDPEKKQDGDDFNKLEGAEKKQDVDDAKKQSDEEAKKRSDEEAKRRSDEEAKRYLVDLIVNDAVKNTGFMDQLQDIKEDSGKIAWDAKRRQEKEKFKKKRDALSKARDEDQKKKQSKAMGKKKN